MIKLEMKINQKTNIWQKPKYENIKQIYDKKNKYNHITKIQEQRYQPKRSLTTTEK